MNSRSWSFSILLPLLFLLVSQSAPAQQKSIDELSKEIDTLSENVKKMQVDLQEIKALLENRVRMTTPQNVTLELGKRPSRGDESAKLTMVEFLDYQCPYCGRFSHEAMQQIDKEYIQTGKLRYEVVQLPLEGLHPSAFKAAEAAECAGEQGKFWEMHDRLFANQQNLDQWKAHAEAVGLDVSKFEDCLNGGREAAEVRGDIAKAKKAGISGTPAFLLAYTDKDGSTITSVFRLVGSQPFSAFKAAIDRLLSEKPETAKN